MWNWSKAVDGLITVLEQKVKESSPQLSAPMETENESLFQGKGSLKQLGADGELNDADDPLLNGS